MTQTAAAKAAQSTPVKIAGGAVFMAASVALMFHRMPHREYVAVHADKPRPGAAAPAAAPAASKPKPAAPAPTPAPPPPAPKTGKPPAPATSPAPATAAPAAAPPVDLGYECRSEVGLFCNHVAPPSLARCLGKYSDFVLKPCRAALKSSQPSSQKDEPADDDVSGS